MKGNRFIGWLIARPGNRMVRSYETAAWFDEYEIDPGCYPVFERSDHRWAVGAARDLPATQVGGCRVSLWGGVPFGNDPAREDIGKRCRVSWSMQRNAYSPECPEFGASDYNGLRFIPINGNAEYGWTQVRGGRDVHRRKTMFPSLDNSRRHSINITRRLRLLPAPAPEKKVSAGG